MSEWRKIWANGLPNEGRSPKSGHRMAAKGIQLPWWWDGGTIFLILGVIWEMSVKVPATVRTTEIFSSMSIPAATVRL